MTRLLAIARGVRRSLPDAEIVFLTSSEAEDVIYREGFAAFKVPSKTLRAEAHLRASTYARMLQTVTLNLLASFHPHVLIVDTFPAGVMQELLPVLRWDAKQVFVFRVQRPDIAHAPLTQNTLQLYDLAIIPHEEGAEEIPLPPGLEGIWTGPILIRDRQEAKSREEAREILGLPPEGKVLYVTFGGGGERSMETALTTTLETFTEWTDLHLAVAHSPLHRKPLRRAPNVTPVAYYPMAELYAAFDAALSAAGYNSVMELLHHGVPSAFVPFTRQVDDQLARAQWVEAAGAGLALTALTPDAIRAAVTQLLEPAQAEAMREAGGKLVSASGAERAAQALCALLS